MTRVNLYWWLMQRRGPGQVFSGRKKIKVQVTLGFLKK